MPHRFFCSFMIVLMTLGTISGCSSKSNDKAAKAKEKSKTKQTEDTVAKSEGSTKNDTPVDESFQPVSLGSVGSAASSTDSADMSKPPKREDVVKGLQPIQRVLVGSWRGTVQRAAAQEEHQWLWDYKTDKNFPALVLKAPNGHFFTELRLTFDPRVQKYLMETKDKEQAAHKFEGTFVAEPQDVAGEDGKTVERTYKLQLTEMASEDASTRWRFLFNQQNNNRYLVDVERARGKGDFNKVDVIGSQREGTSFAKADDDYGDRTCVISEGLGTSTVSHKGRTFWVCCSGCKAAFEDDPETWIAKFEAKKKK